MGLNPFGYRSQRARLDLYPYTGLCGSSTSILLTIRSGALVELSEVSPLQHSIQTYNKINNKIRDV